LKHFLITRKFNRAEEKLIYYYAMLYLYSDQMPSWRGSDIGTGIYLRMINSALPKITGK
jgi:hypothetical protein